MLSKPLCSIVSIAFFLFWVRLWVKATQRPLVRIFPFKYF